MKKLTIIRVLTIIVLNLYFVFVSLCQFTDYDKANAFYDQNQYEEAIPYFLNVTKTGNKKDRIDASDKLATCYRIVGQFDESIVWYEKLIKQDKKNPDYVKKYAISLKNASRFDDAIKELEKYQKMSPTDPMSQNLIESCKLAEKWLSESLMNPEYVVKLNELMTTSASEYSPVFYNNKVVFTSNREGATKKLIDITGTGDEVLNDLYIADVYADPPTLNNLKEVNTFNQEGPSTFSADGKQMFFTTTVRGSRDKKTNEIKTTLQIWHRYKDSQGTWSKAANILKFNSFDYSIGHPTLSEDGKKLFFMSDMPSGFGGADIYMSAYDEIKKEWGMPENLGDNVNSSGNELFPFIYQNNMLFFSSDFHPGMGRLDIFLSKFENNQWSTCENLKPPINTVSDDFGICIDPESFRGFYSTDHFEDQRKLDNIRSFIKKEPFLLVFNGNIFQIKDQALYDGINFYMTEEESNVMDYNFKPENGQYKLLLPNNVRYRLDVREGMMRKDFLSIVYYENKEENKVKIKIEANQQNQDQFKVKGYLTIVNSNDSIKDPIIGATISLVSNNTLIEKTTSGNEGIYKFKTPLEKDKNYLIISEGGKLFVKERVIDLYGIVSNNTKPLENITLEIYAIDSINNRLIDKIQTNEHGEYSYKLQPENNYKIVVNNEKYKPETIEISTIGRKPFAKIEENIKLKSNMPEVIVKGNVFDKEGAPINEANVKISENNNLLSESKTIDNFINISLELNKEYKISIEKENYITQEIMIKTIDDKEINLPKVILDTDKKALKALKDKSLDINGTVESNGVKLANVYIDIHLDGKLEETLKTDSLGNFSTSITKGFENEYYLSFEKANYEPLELKINKNNKDTIKIVSLIEKTIIELPKPKNTDSSLTINEPKIEAVPQTEIIEVQPETVDTVSQTEIVEVQPGTIDTVSQTEIVETQPETAIEYECSVVHAVDNNSPIDNCLIRIISDGENITSGLTDMQGNFKTKLPISKNYSILLRKENYRGIEVGISTYNKTPENLIKDVFKLEKEFTNEDLVASKLQNKMEAKQENISKINEVLPDDKKYNTTTQPIEPPIEEKQVDSNNIVVKEVASTISEDLFIDNLADKTKSNNIIPDVPIQNNSEINNDILKESIVNISGTITDDTNKPLDSTQVLIAQKSEVLNKTITNKEGKYSLEIPANNEYDLISTHKGHFQAEKKIKVENQQIVNDVKLEKIELNKPKEVKNIYFDLNSTILKKESRFELDKLFNFLIINDNLAVKINSHTDERGSENYNMKLSQQRSIAVVTYLIGKGIVKNRLIPMAYGESMLLIKNAQTESEHQKNRRTEFEVVTFDYKQVPDTASLYNVSIDDIDTKITEKGFKAKKNIIYKVQVGASKVQLPKTFFDSLKIKIGDIEIAEYLSKKDSVFKYNTGEFNNIDNAVDMQNKIINNGFDAIIVAFDGDKEISSEELNNYLKYEANEQKLLNQDLYKETEIVNGVKYSVQVGASRTSVAKGIFKRIESNFSNIKITYKKYNDGYYRYNAGVFDDIENAKQLCANIQQMGMQAFVVKFINGQRQLIEDNLKDSDISNNSISTENKENEIPIELDKYFKELNKNAEITYMIQVGAFLKPVDKHLLLLQSIEKMNPDLSIVFYHDEDGFYKCLTGEYYNMQDAKILLNRLKQQQFQAFIVTLQNGQRIK